MSNKNNKDEFFRNEDTLMRRAWIESALEGVRSTLGSNFNALEFGEPAASSNPPVSESRPSAAATQRPALYVAWSAGRRRART
jgi:hypothetical protein